ncbi:MAG TPA: toll/interleukin-1 receptor domain-containing protein [Candidatus Angelobacter sp.]|nr:toll/interleukin-1 receptor domain-containing protein [Candidatus Angelobacter sp.]
MSGIPDWNLWRQSQLKSYDPGRVGDLHRFAVDLKGADLKGLNLSGAELHFADLRNANLEDTILAAVDFGRRWSSADRVMIELPGANLADARLNRAILDNTTFEDTILDRTDFTDAIFARTRFLDVTLATAKGLDFGDHHEASLVDYFTLLRSFPLPLAFLRGCGLPENFIQSLPALLQNSTEYDSCFISYSSKDQGFAKRLHADLQTKGVRCWFAPEDLKIGQRLRRSIDEAIREHDKLMVILSEDSVNSSWVEKEVETAFEKERKQDRTVLLPIRIDDAVIETSQAWAADIRRTRHIGDFCQWKDHDAYKKAFDRLMRNLKAEEKATTQK